MSQERGARHEDPDEQHEQQRRRPGGELQRGRGDRDGEVGVDAVGRVRGGGEQQEDPDAGAADGGRGGEASEDGEARVEDAWEEGECWDEREG